MPQQAKTKDGLVALPGLAAIRGSGRRLQVAEIGPQQGIPERHRLESALPASAAVACWNAAAAPEAASGWPAHRAEIPRDEVVPCLESTRRRGRSCQRQAPESAVLQALEERLQEAQLGLLQRTPLDQLLEEHQVL